MSEIEGRHGRLLKKVAEKAGQEAAETLNWLRSRDDYRPEVEYFLRLAGQAKVKEIEARTGRVAVRLLCNQAPLELIAAAGFQPVKIASGSLAEASFSAVGWPALTCPVVKGILARLEIDPSSLDGPWVVPATCDWVAKFGEMRKMVAPSPLNLKYLELPRLKGEPDSQKRWLEEVFKLKKHLEGLKGGKVTRKDLLRSIAAFNRAWAAAVALKRARLDGKLASVWFQTVMGTYFLDREDRWAERAEALALALAAEPGLASAAGPKVFLAGSPMFFPNFKLPILMEEAGLMVVADDLCSSERVFPPGQVLEDESEYGLLASLAGRYHQGCLCPTFGDNERRVNNILGQKSETGALGVVFAVLKGCHPYDLESVTIEPALKSQGLRFLRLETDYAVEDRQNLLTRLEAFGQSLKGD
ncbi:MAG: 2-hydroxyacyl-CoA dehydratase family protein [Deltaproteobacteria bacterium]|nr:2-hydroxyacyl-CoA dehydratase family protein [Deltaproteobacteria bacterium]